MKLSGQMKSISTLRADAAELIRRLEETGMPFVITRHGEPKAVLLDMESYEQTQETLALLKRLVLGQEQVETGKVTSTSKSFAIYESANDERQG